VRQNQVSDEWLSLNMDAHNAYGKIKDDAIAEICSDCLMRMLSFALVVLCCLSGVSWSESADHCQYLT